MTQARAGGGGQQSGRGASGEAVPPDPGQPPPVSPAGGSYLTLLRSPGALRFSAAAFVGRMPMSMIGLGTVLLIAAATGRYGVAGIVAAAGSVGSALCTPLAARLADRFGQYRVLVPQAMIFAASAAAFVLAAELRAPVWALLASGGAAGATMPSLGSMVRARWSTLLAGTGRLHTAYALESVADEMIFVIGPALVTLLATEVFPASGVIVASAACVAGTLLFAVQRGTQPAPRPRGAALPGPGGRRSPARSGWLRPPTRGLVTLAPLLLFLGAMFSAIDLSTVAFATQRGHRPLAGVILGTLALGSAAGGLWYGARWWRRPLETRFGLTLAWAVAGVATFWAVPGLLLLALLAFICGLGIAPTLMAAFGLIERQAPESRRTEALSWLSSAVAIGVAGGSALAGRIVDAGGARAGYAFAAGCGVAACAVCLAGRGRLRGIP